MVGFLRASFRFFRDRRVLVGSFLAVMLSFVSIVGLYAYFQKQTLDGFVGSILVISGFIWPMIWGLILASIIPKDEYRQGTLELLLMTPITPRRLVVAMSMAPIVITTILFVAVSPGLFLVLSIKHDPLVSQYAFWTAALFLPVTWLAILSSVWGSATKSSKETRGFTRIIGIVVLFYSFLFLAALTRGAKNAMIQTFLLAVAGFNFLIPMITSLVKTTPFSLEDMDSTSDPITMRISGLLAILRSHKETIFEREEGISKYETLEQIRQQTLGGPFLQQQLVRDVTFTALLLISPLFLIGFLSPEITVSPFLRYCYSLILLLTLIFSVSLAMREMLEERSTLRLDSIRVTLLPIQEITRVKEWVANILPYTVTKWCLSFALIFSLLEKGSVATLVVFAFLAFQTWLALSIAAGLGLRLGLSARDELEGSLWIALLFLFWILLPYLGVKLLVFESLGETSRLFLHSLAGISPLYLIHWLVPKAIAADEWSYIFGGLAMQWLLWFGLGYFNRRRIGLAW